jgi:hypothetical protein
MAAQRTVGLQLGGAGRPGSLIAPRGAQMMLMTAPLCRHRQGAPERNRRRRRLVQKPPQIYRLTRSTLLPSRHSPFGLIMRRIFLEIKVLALGSLARPRNIAVGRTAPWRFAPPAGPQTFHQAYE